MVNMTVLSEIEQLVADNAILKESFAQASQALLSLQAEDVHWKPFGQTVEDSGFTLDNLKDIQEKAELQVTGNPLLYQGLRLRTNNVFGRGINVEGKIAAVKKLILEDPWNESVLFCQEAYESNERALYTGGNLYMAYRISAKQFYPIPLAEITNTATNPDIKQDIRYVQRTWYEVDPQTGQNKNEPTIKWYPVLEYYEKNKSTIPKAIGTSPTRYEIDKDVVIIDLRVNKTIGNQYGVPDVLAAMPYAWAHAQYIRNATQLLEAMNTIAWKVVAKNKANASTAGGKVSGAKRAGGTATMTEGTDLVAMPRSGQVDMKDGQTIASYVASALGVSLVALLSDPGAASGSYGAAASLDGPSANTARARQALWKRFYARIYRAIGLSGVEISFPKISEDPTYRIAQTLALGMAGGALFQDEFRSAFIEATDVHPLHALTDLPEPSPFTTGAQYSSEAIDKAASEAQQQATDADNVSGTGVSNGVGASAGNNDLRNMDNGAANQSQ